MSRNHQSTPATTSKFSHKFSGISVWLEPNPSQTDLLLKEMDYLIEKCGGHEAGMHRIVPHCTLLYNTTFPCSMNRQQRIVHVDTGSKTDTERRSSFVEKKQGDELLQQCITEYRKLLDNERIENNTPIIKMIPTSHYYFPYPKTADDGKGFGCAISLLILETTPELKSLHTAVKKVFPPDERHGGGSGGGSNGEGEKEYDALQAKEEVKFQPHMALIYAPEDHGNVTNGWLEEHTVNMEKEKRYLDWTSKATKFSKKNEHSENNNAVEKDQENEQSKRGAPEAAWDAKYLSIWSTEGTLGEWYPIAKLDLLPDD